MPISGAADDAEDGYYFGSDNEELDNPLAALSIRNQRKQIRHELTDPYNRLHSIAVDSEFVKTVSRTYPDFAVVPNLRCGAWYVDPVGIKTVQRDVYFKSMDGHMGEWKFPLRRPNLPFLGIIIENEGVIIVDSTRRGKRFPDALAKTVPIWCAVINRAVYTRSTPKPDWTPEDFNIHTASASVSESERDQIRSRLDGWAADLVASSYTLPQLQKPLRPLHLSPSSRLPDSPLTATSFESFYPVICLSASRYTSGGSSERYGSFNYVPGSGDDHEGWVPFGFGPEHFWRHKARILGSPREELYGLMQQLCTEKPDHPLREAEKEQKATWISKSRIGYCYSRSGQATPDTHGIYIGCQGAESESIKVPQDPKRHYAFFASIINSIEAKVAKALERSQHVQIVWDAEPSSNDRDIGIGIMLVALSLHYDDDCRYVGPVRLEVISKATVSRRLEWIISASQGKLSPSKKILKRVNDYLFSR